MLDVFYSNWSELVAHLREIRAYLRKGDTQLLDTPEQYTFSRIRNMYEERVYIQNGQFVTGLFCLVA